MAFTYAPRVTGSNFEPVALEIRREGVLLPALGVEVSVNIKDQDTKAMVVVDGLAAATQTAGRWEYRFSPEAVETISANSIWLIEWTVKIGSYTFRTPEPGQMSVRKRLG